ncbi:MAG: Zn-ribbon domain-containing OB-fold protein [Actinomycetota bacterium]
MTDAPRKFFMGAPEGAEPFFEATKENKLLIQRCPSCGRHQFYPRKLCIHCGSPDVEWVQASGRGSVHTFTVIHQQGMPGWRDEVPYVAAIIDLEEGVRMTSNIVDCAPGDVTVAMPVEVTFVDEGMYTLPKFRPVD